MAVPDFQSLMRPCLAVHQDERPHTSADLRDRLAELMHVTDEERAFLLPSGSAPLFSNRVAWAVTHLAQARLLDRPAPRDNADHRPGQEVLKQCPDRIDMKVLRQFPEYEEFRTRTRQRKGQPDRASARLTSQRRTSWLPAKPSRSHRLRSLGRGSGSAGASPQAAPRFLEQLVLRLLVKMGYGGLEAPTEHLGAPGDAGLDGLIRLDPLGLDVVYVQAKRYTDRHVGRPDIQAFVGALHGAQASRGVFITTSRFSPEARDYADRVNARLVLIDGPELAALMIEHDCGVIVEESFVLKQVDENFFEEP